MGQYADKFKKADPDMAETVSKVLKMDHDKGRKPSVVRLASDQRTIEHWNSLWSHWAMSFGNLRLRGYRKI